MKKKDYKLVKEYVENKLLKGVNNLTDARAVHEIIFGINEHCYAAGIDASIWRWYTRNLDIVLESDTVILTTVDDPFSGDTTNTTLDDQTKINFNPEKTFNELTENEIKVAKDKFNEEFGIEPETFEVGDLTITKYADVIVDRIIDNATPQMITNELPKRWYLRNEFIDDEGNVFVKGKLKLN